MIYNVTEYGILDDGITNNTKQINSLIEKIDRGGTLFFPAGDYVTGSIFLKSNLSIWLESGATILGSEDFGDYPLIDTTHAPGYTRKGHSALITAFGCENIAIYGQGTINGRGKKWWDSGKTDLERPRTINPILCKNITVKNITLVNSPCWTIHPMCCDNVTIDSVTIRNPCDSPNTDGINPESSRNVRILNCHIDAGDDCIAIKSGTETDLLQKQYPCENIIITGCTMAHGHGGVVIGSEMSGGVRNVTVTNCVFQDTDTGIRMKTRRTRGGVVEGIIVSNIMMDSVLIAISANCYYYWGTDRNDKYIFSPEKKLVRSDTPVIKDIHIDNVSARNVKGAGIYLYGLPEAPVRNISISNSSFFVTGNEEGINPVAAPDRNKVKSEGIFMENAENIVLNQVGIHGAKDKFILRDCVHIYQNGELLSPPSPSP